MLMRPSVLLLTFLWGFTLSPVCAEIYKTVEPNGRVYYSEKTIASLYNRYTKKTPTRITRQRTPAPKQYDQPIKAAAEQYGVDARLIHAVIRAESDYRPDAISPKGAIGLMQLMPFTAQRFSVIDSYDPIENINGGTHYLSELLKLFESDIKLAVAAYNAGEKSVFNYGKRIPPFSETQAYVARVMTFYHNSK